MDSRFAPAPQRSARRGEEPEKARAGLGAYADCSNISEARRSATLGSTRAGRGRATRTHCTSQQAVRSRDGEADPTVKKDFRSRLQDYIDKEVERRVEQRLHEILDSLGIQSTGDSQATVKSVRAPRERKKPTPPRKRTPVSEETRAKMREAWARRKARQAGVTA